MLNELYHLSAVLERDGIETYEWQKDLKPLPNASDKKPCYRICINYDSSVTSIEPINKSTVTVLRKWERNNGDSFPGFNIPPLYRITDENSKALLKKWRERKEPFDVEKLKEWCSNLESNNWDDKTAKKIKKCVVNIPEELYKLCESAGTDFDVVRNLCQRTIALEHEKSNEFFQALESFVWRSLERGEHILSLLPFLIHEGASNKKPAQDRGTVSVFMDIPDWKEYPVAHEKTIIRINNLLLHQMKVGNRVGSGDKDAFGQGMEGFKEKLPEVKLPVLGSVKLRAMFSEIPCQYRYGTIDTESYIIGASSRRATKGALEWLKDESHEGRTWGRVGGGEILFAYPSAKLSQPIKLASCFGARKQDDTEARFAKYAEDVLNGLKGISPSLKNIEIRLFSLRKMDKARTKVVFYRNYSAQRLADAAKEWQDGCTNIPEIQLRTWAEEKGRIISDVTKIPFPLDISKCLNRIWKSDGTSRDEIDAVPEYSGIELLFNESTETCTAPHLLAIAIQNGKALFLSLGHTLHRNEILSLKGRDKYKQLMPPILGLLLLKLGMSKEDYMNDIPYLLGRMLKLADELHAVYCKEVRNGSLPSQLLGNALMVAALDSPTQALSQLALRIAPYLGWARTNSTNSAGLSRYFLKEIGSIGNKLEGLHLPTRFDDLARAQLLLGYVSTDTHFSNSASTTNGQKGENHE